MSEKTWKISLLSTATGLLGCAIMFHLEIIKRDALPLWAVKDESIERLPPAVPSGPSEVGPTELFAVYDEQTIFLMATVASVLGLIAVWSGYKNVRHGNRSPAAGIGMVSGLVALIWNAKLYLYGV